MSRDRVCWGPPGTGKTFFGTGLASQWFEAGVAADEVAYLAFTKAAAVAAAVKIYGSEADEDKMREKFPLFRTIHSLSFKGLKRENPDVDLLEPAHLKKFGRESGLKGLFMFKDWEDLTDAYGNFVDKAGAWTDWDNALTTYMLSRVLSRTPAELQAVRVRPARQALYYVDQIGDGVYRSFVDKYELFKQREGLVDFTDMLEHAATKMRPLEKVRYVILDEAQDLSPIHHGIIDRLFPNAEEIWWIGDDDQALYRFCGASAELFLERASKARYEVNLRQTHRFGQQVVDFSRRIIKRVTNRKEKEVVGAPGAVGEVRQTGSFKPMHGPYFILHRHVRGCQAIADAYIEAGLPFRNERGKDPLKAEKRVKAFKAFALLAEGKRAPFTYINHLVSDEIPSRLDDEARTEFVVRGAKAKLDETKEKDAMNLADLVQANILTEEGVKLVRDRNRLVGIVKHKEDFQYYERVVRNGHGLDGQGCAKITTIHGSKGRETEKGGEVVVFSAMSKRCWDDPDSEHRLAYVASTRTKTHVTICGDVSEKWMRERYEYPVEGGENGEREQGDAAWEPDPGPGNEVFA